MNDPLNLSAADWLAIEKAEYEDSLCSFIVGINGEGGAWRVLERKPLVEGWHLRQLCAHLEAITDGRMDRLCISIPPGYMKSLVVNVFWPAWEWTRHPHLRIVTASGKQEACDRDAEKMRNLVQSDWYQRYWKIEFPSVNAITRFVNDSFGERTSSSFASLTGLRADRLLLDDVLTVEQANSEIERGKVHRKFFEQATSRGNGEEGAIVIVAQRISESDLIGEIQSRQDAGADMGFHFLTIPLEYEGNEEVSTADFLPDEHRRDPRTIMGELLLPAYQGRRWADRQKATMTPYAYSAQYQQSPIPRGESFFREGMFKVYQRGELPSPLNHYITSDHSTGHTAKSDYQVIRVWGQDSKKHWWLIDSYRERSSFNDALGVEMQDGKYALKAKGALPFIKKYRPLRWFADGDNIIRQSLPMIRDLQVELQAHCRIEIVNQGSQNKGERAVPYQALAEAGRVHLPEGPIADAALAEYLAFTGRNDKMDDQVDADGLIARMATHPAVSAPVERQGRRDDYYVEGSDGDGEASPTANCF